jgi:hypothetical protein
VPVTGVAALGQVGSVFVGEGVGVYVTGVGCLASITSVTIWISINDDQTPSWVQVNDSQVGPWTVVNDAQSSNWAEIIT